VSATTHHDVSGRGPETVARTGVAVVGVGYWGRNYMRVVGELADARVSMMCDESIEALSSVCTHYPSVISTSNYDDVLASPDVTAVIISTHATTHYELASRALEAGKDVLVEKPLTTNATEATDLVSQAAAANRVLLTGHTFIYNPGIQAIRGYIRRFALGKIYYLYARRTNLGPIRTDVDASWDLASHDVAIFNYLLEDTPRWASAVGIDALGCGRQDAAFISLGYEGGVVGHVHVSWAEPNKVREVVVVGSDGRLAFDDLNPTERVRIFEKGVKAMPQMSSVSGFGKHLFSIQDGDITSPAIPALEPLKSLCGHFLHCIRRGERPLTPGEHGVDVVRTMEAISESIRGGGAPIYLDGAGTPGVRGEHALDGSVR
jgi:predicted dehydrogenase